MALINLVQQENFTFLQILQENITLIAERVCIGMHTLADLLFSFIEL